MLRGDFVPRTNDPTLEQREGRLYGVRAVNVLLRAVVHDAMLMRWHRSLLESRRVGYKVVRHDHVNITRNVLADVLRQRARLRIFRMEEPQVAVTLTDADDNLLGPLACVNALADLLWFGCLLYSVADAMAEIPSCPIVNLQHPMKLVSTHPFLGLAKQVDRKKPLRERQVCIVKHRTSRNRELVAA